MRVMVLWTRAVEWVKRCPVPADEDAYEIEIRPVFEPSDFGPALTPALTPELREAEARLRTQAAATRPSSGSGR